jgi:membrane protein implicated in regulation of membrane protease activity
MNIFDWSSLGILEKVFAVIGLTAFLLIILQTIMSVLGGDVHHDLDVSAEDGDMGHAWGLFSVRGFFGFLLGLGWGGLIALQRGWSGLAAIVVGALAGLIIAFLLGLLMKAINTLRSDGTLKMENAIGKTGTVYQRIPASRGGQGKVQILVQGRMQTLEAITDADADLTPQREVKVTAIASGNLLVVA